FGTKNISDLCQPLLLFGLRGRLPIDLEAQSGKPRGPGEHRRISRHFARYEGAGKASTVEALMMLGDEQRELDRRAMNRAQQGRANGRMVVLEPFGSIGALPLEAVQNRPREMPADILKQSRHDQ